MDSASPQPASELTPATERPLAGPLVTAGASSLLGAIGNRGVARLAQGSQADRQQLQRYVLQQAVAVTGTQFHAQVKQANGSFRNAGGVVVASGPANTQLRVSEDGQMAVEDTNLGARQPKVFYATNTVFNASNKALKKHGSAFVLYVDQNNAITVTDQAGNQVNLHRILAKRKKVRNAVNDRGMGLTMKEVCDQVASEIVGHDVSLLLPNLEKDLAMNNALAAHE